MSDITNENINKFCDIVAELRKKFTKSLKINKNKPDIELIRQMRVIHGNAIRENYMYIQQLSNHKNNIIDDNSLLRLSTNSSLIHVIHTNIRHCENVAYSVSKDKTKHTFKDGVNDIGIWISNFIDANGDHINANSCKIITSADNALQNAPKAVIRNDKNTGVDILSIKNIETSVQKPTVNNSDNLPIPPKSSTPLTTRSDALDSQNTNLSEYLNNLNTSDANELSQLHSTYVKQKYNAQGGDSCISNQVQNVASQANTSTAQPAKINDSRSASDLDYLYQKYDVNKPTLINYWADWCGYSKRFINDWNNFIDNYSVNYPDLQILDLNVARDSELAELGSRVGIKGYPTIVLFQNGNEIDSQVVGSKDAEFVKRFVDDHLNQ